MTSFDDPPPYAPGHRGIDLSTSLGQVVVAAGDGTVTTAGAVAGRPIVVVAHSPTLRTTYLPVVPLVRLGDRVRAGEPIGVVSTPSHCPTTCLHWGARRGDRYIDPLSLLPLDAGPIVLLPLDP
jgi:murein DD-endopeptidase MepM/ murein hydrolase activator NlpD